MKIAIYSDITLDLVIVRLKAGGAELVSYSFGNLASDLLKPSERVLNEADFAVIHLDQFFSRYDRPRFELLKQALGSFSESFSKNILISSQLSSLPTGPLGEMPGSLKDEGLADFEAFAGTLGNVYFYDHASVIAEAGLKNAYHFGLGHLYQMPYTNHVIPGIADCMLKTLKFLSVPEKKVIVTDLDNTMWGGILGEDGKDNVKVGNTADGIVFMHYQEFLLRKKNEGFLLAICSKNNIEEVEEMFRSRHMPLGLEDFVAVVANWEDKYANLQQIAASLNLGTDSLIFIDDNAFELESVKQLLPDTEVREFRNDYHSFLELSRDPVFWRKRILAEDREKTEQYRVEKLREEIKSGAAGFDEFVKNLGIRIQVKVNEGLQLERLAQMTEKTNQFNFNKEVFNPGQLAERIDAGWDLFELKVADKFGDYGIVGFAMVEYGTDGAVLHNMLMSCRVLGRGVEQQFFAAIGQAIQEKGHKLVQIRFRETERNQPAQEFYRQINIQHS